MPSGRFWTTGELARLREMAGQHPTWYIGMTLNRTGEAIRRTCCNLGISCGRFWTAEELACLQEMADQHPPWQIGMRLDRTASAIRAMCRTLAISYRQEVPLARDTAIEQMAGLMSTPAIAWKLECSTRTVQARARALGVSLRMIRLNSRPLLPAKKPHHPGLTYIRTPGLIRKRWKARPGGQYIGHFATEAEAWTAIKERNHVGLGKSS